MTRITGRRDYRDKPACDFLHDIFEIDPLLKCVELSSSKEDGLGTVTKLTQLKEGVRLECADVRVNYNVKRGDIIVSGEFYLTPPPSSRPTYEPGDAVELAL